MTRLDEDDLLRWGWRLEVQIHLLRIFYDVHLLQQIISESTNRQYRYMQFGYHTSSNTPAAYQTDCPTFCQYFMWTGLGSGPFAWWGMCFNAGSLLNNVPTAASNEHLIPPATKRIRNYTECLRKHYVSIPSCSDVSSSDNLISNCFAMTGRFMCAAVDCTNSLGRMQYAAGTPVYRTERYVTTFTCQSGYRWSDNAVGTTARSGTCTDMGAGVGNWVVGYSCVGVPVWMVHLFLIN